VCIIGAGYSAATLALSLDQLRAEGEGPSHVLWLTRASTALPYARLANDPLPSRDSLCARANALCANISKESDDTQRNDERQVKRVCGACPLFVHVPDTTVLEVEDVEEDVKFDCGTRHEGRALELTYSSGWKPGELVVAHVDTMVALVGYRPASELSRELQVHLCYASEGPMKLAASLLAASAGGGDCMSQAAPGVGTLLTPEPNFFVLGSKSYGRNPSFLLRVGFAQAALVAGLLAKTAVAQSAP